MAVAVAVADADCSSAMSKICAAIHSPRWPEAIGSVRDGGDLLVDSIALGQ